MGNHSKATFRGKSSVGENPMCGDGMRQGHHSLREVNPWGREKRWEGKVLGEVNPGK